MSAKSATLAKSLHTVSAIVAVARIAPEPTYPMPAANVPAYRVGYALNVLGYAGAADPYGLAARAVAQLQKSAQ